MRQDFLRNIPSVNELLESPEISAFSVSYPRPIVVEAIRGVLDDVRRLLVAKGNKSQQPERLDEFPGIRNEEAAKIPVTPPSIDLTPQAISLRVRNKLQHSFSGIEHAVNATGIILHTGLGRAPLANEAAQRVQNVLQGFCTLEIEKDTGKRGVRYDTVERLVCMITGAEAALAVNNNAAAVMLALDTLAKGREVIVSRSQLVEIGGSFRMPDVMAKSGAILVEVGTTNKTYPDDYRRAVTERTGLILKVHQSNFKIVGFTDTVDIKELTVLGQAVNVPVMYDLGSGALIDLQRYGLPHEPTVLESIRDGTDVVTFSTDKLLGGPQGGIIAGKKKWIDLMEKNPLLRALRVGKLTIAAMEATLRLYLDGDHAVNKIPVLKMIVSPLDTIDERCKRVVCKLSAPARDCLNSSITDGFSEMGGGSLPGERIPTRLVVIHAKKIPALELAARLRNNTPPIFTRIEQDRVCLDMRTVYNDAEVDIIVTALERISTIENS